MVLPDNVEDLDKALLSLRAVPKAVNKIAVDELRHTYDILNKSIDKLQTKTLTFLAATLALLTFLYSGGDLFIPAQVYGRIFYFLGLALVLTAVIMFLLGLKPVSYQVPTTIAKLKDIKERDEQEYLEYVKQEYISTFDHNKVIYESKHADLYRGFVLLTLGAFILIIIKTFPDNAKTCYNVNAATCSATASNKGATK